MSMTTPGAVNDVLAEPSQALNATAQKRRPAVPLAYAIFAAVSWGIFVGMNRTGTTTFQLSTERDLIQLPPLATDSALTTLVLSILLTALVGVVAMFSYRRQTAPLWVHVIFSMLFLAAFLTWAATGQVLPVPGLLIGAVGLAVPLIFGGLGGVISERVGVVNVAIEGQLLAGAFVSAVVASLTQNPFAGLVGAMLAGALVSAVLATFSIRYWVDQVIVGVVLNVLVTGLTSFLFAQLLTQNAQVLNSPPRFPALEIPLLSQIPIIGPALFRQSFVVYLLYIAVIAVAFSLFNTRWGLRVRALGEHPEAADTVGIRVNVTRFWTVSLAGAITGLGGAYFTLGSIGSFQKEMTAGMGYIALAAVIFGRWDPLRTALAALLFGFATNLQYVLGVIGSPVPSEFLLMLPYLVTIVAVAGLVGHVNSPAAAGKPYASR